MAVCLPERLCINKPNFMKLDEKMEHTHYNLINRELTLMDDAFSECHCSFVLFFGLNSYIARSAKTDSQ